jgi:hypothetical protein
MTTLQNSLKRQWRFLRLSGELIINLGNNLCAFFFPPLGTKYLPIPYPKVSFVIK